MTYQTTTIFIKSTHPLFRVIDEYAFLCKNLKNSVLYLYRQALFKHNQTLNKFAVINELTQIKQVDYCAIPRKVSQQIVFQVAQEFKSFWGLMDLWRKDKSTSKPSIPQYLHKQKGRANVIFTKQAVSKKYFTQGILSLSAFDNRPIHIKLGKLANIINYDKLQEVRLVKVADGYELKISYKTTHKQAISDIPKRVLSVDFGINNLMTVANNIGMRPFIIKGKALKSFNQYFNKKLAKLKSKLAKANDYLKPSIQKKLNNLYRKRKHKLNDYLHKSSRYLINHAVENQADSIIIGYNRGWKQEIKLGQCNNQKFAYIPFLTLLKLIQYKAEQQGIRVIITQESYTSKCSFLDDEPIQKHSQYQGKRIKRGLFKSATGKIINADVNAALNILRKVIGNFSYDPVQVCSTPKMVNILN